MMADKQSINFMKILIIRTDRIGDVILSTPVLTALKSRFPTAFIAIMVRTYTKEIIEGHPDVDEIMLYDSSNFKNFLHVLKQLRKRRFDLAIMLHPTFYLASLIFLARIPTRLSTGYRWYSFLFNKKVYEHRKTAEHHELDYNLRMLQKIDIPIPKEILFKFHIPLEAEKRITELIQNLAMPQQNKIVVVHPGSGGSAFNWPLKKFSQLCDQLSSLQNVSVILTAGPDEHELVDKILKNTQSEPIKIVDSLTLKQMAALIKRSHLFISNSTGPLHLAVAVGTEVIAFYCPIIPCLPARWGPYNKIEDSVLMPQVPFYCKKCSFTKCPYYYCMDKISVEQAIELAKKKLNL